MATIRASFLVAIVAAWSALGGAASAASTAPGTASPRCEAALTASAVGTARDDTFVELPVACESPSDGQQSWPSPVQPYDGFGATSDPIRVKHGNEFFGTVAAFAHVFFAFDAAAAHHLIPHFSHHHRAAPPPDSIPNF